MTSTTRFYTIPTPPNDDAPICAFYSSSLSISITAILENDQWYLVYTEVSSERPGELTAYDINALIRDHARTRLEKYQARPIQ